MAGITSRGEREVQAGVEGLARALKRFKIIFNMDERSQIIAAVHHAFDDVSDSVDDDEFRAAFQEAFANIDKIADLTGGEEDDVSEEMKAGFAESMRALMVSMIDARDLIDTEEFKTDILTMPYDVAEE